MSRSKTRHSAMKTVTKTRSARGSGVARRPYGWLGAGALGVGVCAALAGGAGVAHAEGPAAEATGPGSAGRGASATATSGVARGPSRVAASRVARPAPVSSVGASAVESGSHPVSVAVAAVASRIQRELRGVPRSASTVAAVGGSDVSAAPSVYAVVAAPVAAVAANPFVDLVRVLVSNGTAENPNAGILAGNGYT